MWWGVRTSARPPRCPGGAAISEPAWMRHPRVNPRRKTAWFFLRPTGRFLLRL